MAKGTQHKLDNVRKPRVQITYDVEIGDAQEMKELPFVMGVMSDLSGASTGELPKFKERKFVNVDRDNFNDYLKKQAPKVTYKVDNTLSDDPDAQLAVDMSFEKLADFGPEQVAENVPVLKELLDVRKRLQSLQAKVTSSDEVTDFLKEILDDEDKRNAVAAELGVGGGGDTPAEPDAGGDDSGGEPTPEA
jgi:type VI secretion system protein ImpB